MEKVLYQNTLFRSTTPAWAAAKKPHREGVAIHFGAFLRVKGAECVVRPKNHHRRGGYTHAFRSVAFRVEDGKSDISPTDLFKVSAKTVTGAMRALGAEYQRSVARMKAHLARLAQTEADVRRMKEAGVTHPSKAATYRLILRSERRSVQRKHDLWKAAMASSNYAMWVFRSRFFPKFPESAANYAMWVFRSRFFPKFPEPAVEPPRVPLSNIAGCRQQLQELTPWK